MTWRGSSPSHRSTQRTGCWEPHPHLVIIIRLAFRLIGVKLQETNNVHMFSQTHTHMDLCTYSNSSTELKLYTHTATWVPLWTPEQEGRRSETFCCWYAGLWMSWAFLYILIIGPGGQTLPRSQPYSWVIGGSSMPARQMTDIWQEACHWKGPAVSSVFCHLVLLNRAVGAHGVFFYKFNYNHL